MITTQMFAQKYFKIVRKDPEELRAANLRMNFFKDSVLKKNNL